MRNTPTRLITIWFFIGFIALATLTLAVRPVFAAAGIFESYIVLNNTYHDVNADTVNPDFNGQNLGVFVAGSLPLMLNGSEIKTYKNTGSDITSARLNYRIYPTGSPSGSFTAVNLPFNADLVEPVEPGNNDQSWSNTAANINLLTGLSDGNYTLEIYYDASTNGTDTANLIYDSNGGANFAATFTVASTVSISDAQALWLDENTIGWNGSPGASYKLLYDPNGGLVPATSGSTACIFPLPASPCYVSLSASGIIGGYTKNPNATGLPSLLTGLTVANAKQLLTGQTAVASYNGGDSLIDISGVQIQSVLDNLYPAAAAETLGISYSGSIPTFKVWAPTAQNVVLYKYEDATTLSSSTHLLTLDSNSGVWSITGDATWDRDYYLLGVNVYVPSLDAVVTNTVSDPYAITLSADSASTADPRSQFVNLNDASLKPTGWDSLSKPALAAFEDITVYEMHIRDFSINDSTVASTDRGTYMAFTYDGPGPDTNTNLSDGMTHLLALSDAGLSHVHLMPTFDSASVNEDSVPRTVSPNPTEFARNAQDQQTAVSSTRATDGFNWGYDPYHYGAPEGSYSTDPSVGTQRILEFRRMVSALNQNDLRVVMDVVYNHTAAAGQDDKSVLDKIVPGYYYRYDSNGTPYNSSCCADTAAEYTMMEKLMIDTLIRFAVDYKIDGFRFDLMNLHTRQNMLNVQTAVKKLTLGSDGVDGNKIYLYGEGWDFGSAAAKGLTTCPDCYAKQTNMSGTGIGTFNDRLRDAAHGGYSTDPTQIRAQGFSNGLSYDWNGYLYSNRFQSDLHTDMDILRSALRASGSDWNGLGNPYTADPQESVPYVSKHDNETLFDQNVFKLPDTTTMAERVRAQNMGLSLVGLAQGVPFFDMGSDILRSKSLDRNSYDSGDWFNRVNWDLSSNNFGQGLPPTWDNNDRWSIMSPLLANTDLDPSPTDMAATAAHLREILRIRQSSPLFRLQTEAEVNTQVSFYNGSNAQDALIVMALNDSGATDLDASYETILVIFNANKTDQAITIAGANAFTLHPIHTDGVDDDAVITGGASFVEGTDTFTVPARTTAVFVSPNLITPPTPPSTLDFVERMWPRGGAANAINQGNFVPTGFDFYVQVYEAGLTNAVGQGAGISCSLSWGAYGQPWSDVTMTYNGDIGNNDEYKATIPQATLNSLTPGTYGFTAYCQKAGEDKKWKQDLYDIDTNALDDDQGDGLITVIPSGDAAIAPVGGVFVHLFEWPWTDIEKECSYLAEMGYTAVQVSPPNEHLIPTVDQGGQPASDFPWWVRYQPITHDVTKLTSRSGALADFQSMVTTCNGLGVGIYVDAVINHTADIEVGIPPAGTAGTQYESGMPGRFYGTQYDANDFHTDCDISSYADRAQVQRCQLSGLPDLDTGRTAVQTDLHNYMQALIDMGVAGFRIDGAKHIAAQDISAIVDGLTGSPYIFQEVIDVDAINERVRDWEYTPSGDVTEFAYSINAISKFNTGSLADLETLPYSDMMNGRFAVVFTDNHDNQRGHGPGGANIVDHRDGANYDLANIFMLAYPYGYPAVMSSYYWSNNPASNAGDSYGPPSSSDGGITWGVGRGANTRPVYGASQSVGDVPENCNATYEDGKWVCEHRRTAIANMVQFRAVAAGEAVTNWWDDGANHIAFGRGSQGFVSINNSGTATNTTYQTSMAAGTYCDVTQGQRTPDATACTGRSIIVNVSGQIVGQALGGQDAFAIHDQSRIGAVQLTAVLPTNLALNGVGNATATLLTHEGKEIVGGNVTFALLSGQGSLGAASVFTNGSGEAAVDYTAPNGVTISIVSASYTGSDSQNYVAYTAVSVGYRANVADLFVNRLASGLETAVIPGAVAVTKQGAGTPLLMLAVFDGNPQSSRPEGGESSPYVDIHLPSAVNVDSLAVTITCNPSPCGSTVWWGNPVTGVWTAVTANDLAIGINAVTFTLNGSSSPTLNELAGTPFVVSTTVPLAITLSSGKVGVNGGETAVIGFVFLFLLALSGWVVKRHHE